MASTPEKSSHMLEAFLHGEYSDMKVNCGGLTFNTHRVILSAQSHFFKSAMSSGFKESLNQSIDLPDDDPACIERVLSFLYLHDYEETGHTLSLATLGRGLSTLNQTTPAQKRKFSAIQDEPATHTVPAEHVSPSTEVSANSSPETVTPKDDSSEVEIIFNNIDVYLAADKFGITDLQALAASRICAWLSTNVQSKVFLSAAMKIMRFKLPSDMTLKDHLAEVMSKNLSVLLPEDDFVPILDEFGCLGSAILQKYRGKQLFAMEVLRFGPACRSCRPFKGGYLEEKPGQLRVCCKRCHSPLHGGVL